MNKFVRLFLYCSLCLLSFSYGQTQLVFHERSTAAVGCGTVRYLSQVQPAPTDTLRIGFKVQQQLQPQQGAVYYTIDGSNPSGSLGRGTGTTLVVPAQLDCSSGGYMVLAASLPPLQAGTVVKYIFSAWNGSQYELFGNSETCTGCQPITTSTNATQFSYAVQGVLPITFVHFSGREGTQAIRVYWASAQESDMAYYEVYRSRNSLQFEKIGTVPAMGNTSQRTDYFFDDRAPLFGNNYYRVTAVDRQGKSVSTSIQRVLFGKNDNSLVVFANPSSSLLNIRVVDIIKGDYVVRIFDGGGRLIHNSPIKHNGADGVYPVQLPQPLARGNYRLVLTNRYQFYTSSFLME
jgi:hypothetical protein